MGISKKSFGVTKDGKETFLYTISNKNGMKAAVSNFGAILVQLIVPDKKGGVRDVVLGFDSVAGYEGNDCFFGSTIGRNANRIGGAEFELDGTTVHLAANEKAIIFIQILIMDFTKRSGMQNCWKKKMQ